MNINEKSVQVAKNWATQFNNNEASQSFISLLRSKDHGVPDEYLVKLFSYVPWEKHASVESWARLWTGWWDNYWSRHATWKIDAVGTRKLPKSFSYAINSYSYWDLDGPETFDNKNEQARSDMASRWERVIDEAHWAQRSHKKEDREIALKVLSGCVKYLSTEPQILSILYPNADNTTAAALSSIFPNLSDKIQENKVLFDNNDAVTFTNHFVTHILVDCPTLQQPLPITDVVPHEL